MCVKSFYFLNKFAIKISKQPTFAEALAGALHREERKAQLLNSNLSINKNNINNKCLRVNSNFRIMFKKDKTRCKWIQSLCYFRMSHSIDF